MISATTNAEFTGTTSRCRLLKSPSTLRSARWRCRLPLVVSCKAATVSDKVTNNKITRNGKAKVRKTKEKHPWRLFDIVIPAHQDPGKDDYTVHQTLCDEVSRRLGCETPLPSSALTLIRKSFDARPGKLQFVYIVDVKDDAAKRAAAKKLQKKPGRLERAPVDASPPSPPITTQRAGGHKVLVVGSGPAGLFSALTLAEAGVKVVLLERGQPVESRGRDIGALFVRKQLNPDSNLCYGEGGAGTWSDGKLTTRVGRNSDPVRRVLNTLNQLGAPQSILLSGKPHLGTDRLVRILKEFRHHLQRLGVEIKFGVCVDGLLMEGAQCRGVITTADEKLHADAVVLATGHSSRELYRRLCDQGVAISPKPFSMGFRIEHPQSLINAIQYGEAAATEVKSGRGKLPVADYRLSARVASTNEAQGDQEREGGQSSGSITERGVYSFCMCPGGQIVPTSTHPQELCINGMSFSRRHSVWANSAVVVAVGEQEWRQWSSTDGPLAGMKLQSVIEREAAVRGGGDLVAPVQRATDFMNGVTSISSALPSSSYRLGVLSAPLHNLYSPQLTVALRQALHQFDVLMPGFLCGEALLHGVETRTSAPLRIERGDDCQSVSTAGLFPCGEGGGYAGGIVSAAVDGMTVAQGIMKALALQANDRE